MARRGDERDGQRDGQRDDLRGGSEARVGEEQGRQRQTGAQHPGGYSDQRYDAGGKLRPGGIQRGGGQQPDPHALPVNVYGGLQHFHELKSQTGPEAHPEQGWADFRGVSPRGYRRSAARIRDEICHLLTDHPTVDPSLVEVEVDEDGVVHLYGHTRSRAMKRTAENLCDQVQGVRDVDNRIEIDR